MADTHVQLAGSRRPLPHNAIRVRDVDPHAIVEITITLKGPALPAPGQMPDKALSREEIAQRFGVPADTVRKVGDVLRAYGLQVVEVKQGGRSIRVRGPASAMIAAFRPELGIYHVPGQGQIRARHGVLMVPGEIADVVEGVFGLDQRRMAQRHAQAAAAQARALAPLTPADLVKRYHFPAGDGAGRTVAIAEFGQNIGNGQVLPPAYLPSDVAAFCTRQGLPQPVVRIESVGLSPLSEQQFKAEIQELPKDLQNLLFMQTAETMMDIQIVAGLCPKADIGVYFATWGESGWINLLDEVTSGSGPVPVALSISYGLAEEAADWSHGAMASINQRLQIAAMQGVTVCVSSGDDGSGCNQPGKRCHVEFPTSSPYVLSVGGTMLVAQADGTTQEVAWWEAPGERTQQGGGGSTGGGVSVLNPRPPWQTVSVASLNPSAPDGRVVPDVAALAGPPLYDLQLDGQPLPDGGTSAAAPLWAALVARIDAALPAGKRQRFLAPLLYKGDVGRAGFSDIVSGQNTSRPSPGKGYTASAGFDAVSGWGVPNGQGLLQALAAV